MKMFELPKAWPALPGGLQLLNHPRLGVPGRFGLTQPDLLKLPQQLSQRRLLGFSIEFAQLFHPTLEVALSFVAVAGIQKTVFLLAVDFSYPIVISVDLMPVKTRNTWSFGQELPAGAVLRQVSKLRGQIGVNGKRTSQI